MKTRWRWRKDLSEFRGLTDVERSGFLLVLEWFENFRLRHEMEAGRDAAKAFWRTEVLREGVTRESWQLDQWENAIRWYMDWLAACAEEGADHRSLAERVRAAVNSAGARRGLALRTKQCYGAWAARFAVFAGGEREVLAVAMGSRFLQSVVEDEDCAYSTQKQALNALAFFFKQVCGVEDPVFNIKLRKTAARIPVVLSQNETQRVFEQLDNPQNSEGHYGLPARLQYGSGLRLSELVRLRIKDVDVERGTVTVRQGKGAKDRCTVLPASLRKEVAQQIERAREVWKKDREARLAGVYLPPALARKLPKAGTKWAWMWLFPSDHLSKDPDSEIIRRHHLHPKTYGEAIRRAAEKAGIAKRVTTHALRHAFATHLSQGGTDIRTLQELLGHTDVKTTEIYTKAANIGNDKGVRSPLDVA